MADRLISADALKKVILSQYPDAHYPSWYAELIDKAPSVNAVELPYPPRPMMKDKNPFNTDVYCPECGTNLSGYYGDDPLPIVTCFNCGDILDPYKATTWTSGEKENQCD